MNNVLYVEKKLDSQWLEKNDIFGLIIYIVIFIIVNGVELCRSYE